MRMEMRRTDARSLHSWSYLVRIEMRRTDARSLHSWSYPVRMEMRRTDARLHVLAIVLGEDGREKN